MGILEDLIATHPEWSPYIKTDREGHKRLIIGDDEALLSLTGDSKVLEVRFFEPDRGESPERSYRF